MAITRQTTPLREALAEDGRKQEWLARQIGASPQEVSRWASGMHEPILHTRTRIANALGRPVDELFPDAKGTA